MGSGSTPSPVETCQAFPHVELTQTSGNFIAVCSCSSSSPYVRNIVLSEDGLYVKPSSPSEHDLVVLDQDSTERQGMENAPLMASQETIATEAGYRSRSVPGMECSFIKSGTVRGHVSSRVLSGVSGSNDGEPDVSLSSSRGMYGQLVSEVWEPATTAQLQ